MIGPGTRERVLVPAVTSLVALAFFSLVAVFRVVDMHEGSIILAGRALFEERLLPYRDFFVPELPGAILLFGLVQRVFAIGWMPVRVLAGAGAALTALLVFVAAERRGGRRAGLSAAVLYAAHLLVWEWATTSRTAAVALPLLMGALVLATDPGSRGGRWLLAGLFAGLAVATRLLAIPVVLAVLMAALRGGRGPASRGRAAKVVLGCALGVSPAVVFAGLDPGAFWFDTIQFRAEGEVLHGIATVRALLLSPLGATRPDVTGLQDLALGVLALLECRRRDADAVVYALSGLGLVGTACVASPAAMHDFSLAVAPLSVLAGSAVSRLATPAYRFALPAGYALCAATSFRDRIVVQPAFARPAAFDAVGRVLDLVTHEGDRVAAHFPAYLAGSTRRPLAEARALLAPERAEGIGPSNRGRMHLYTEADLRAALLEGRARAFVVGTLTDPGTAIAVREAGWQRRSDLVGATVWLAPEPRP